MSLTELALEVEPEVIPVPKDFLDPFELLLEGLEESLPKSKVQTSNGLCLKCEFQQVELKLKEPKLPVVFPSVDSPASEIPWPQFCFALERTSHCYFHNKVRQGLFDLEVEDFRAAKGIIGRKPRSEIGDPYEEYMEGERKCR